MQPSITRIRASDGTGNASVATVQVSRSPGATTIQVDTVQGIPTEFIGSMGTPHTFTDPITGETITVISEASAVDFAGHVDGSDLEIDEIADGYVDGGSDVGDIIIIRPTTQYGNNLADVIQDQADSLASTLLEATYGNAIINGGMQIAQRVTAPTISSSYQYGAVDRFAAKGGGTAVSAGTIGQTSTPSVSSRSGFALRLAGVTLTGTGIVYLRYRMEAKDALRFKNAACSLALRVWHDVGSAKNATIYVRKATASDNFTSVTDIANSGAISVPNNTSTLLEFENINSGNIGDVSNGIEIEVQIASGAITTKNFEFADLIFTKTAEALTFQAKTFEAELRACQRYYEKCVAYETAPGAAIGITNGAAYGGTDFIKIIPVSGAVGARSWANEPFKVPKRTTPTIRYWDGAGNLSRTTVGDANMATTYTNQAETFRGMNAYKNGFVFQNAPTSNWWTLITWDADAEL